MTIMEERDGKVCGNCRFCGENTDDEKLYVCRKNPPTVISAEQQDIGWACFPIVDTEEDWCGEFKPTED